MRVLRPLFCVLLAVALSASGVATASPHGAAGHAHSIEICADGEIVTVSLGAQGGEEAPAQPCLDCLPVAAFLSGPPPAPQPPSALRAAAFRSGQTPAPAIGVRGCFRARAPPLPV